MRHLPGADPAVDVLIGCIDALAIGTSPLIVGEPSGRIARAVAALPPDPASRAQVDRQPKPATWLRRAGGPVPARPWPAPGPFTAALIRLPKSKDELTFLLDAAASVLADSGPLFVFGANDEGIRSAAPVLAGYADNIETLTARSHCRVIAGLRRPAIAGLIGSLEGWRQSRDIDIGRGARPWISYPGLFARGRLDDGTRLLIEHLPPLSAGARVLDYACGTGVIAAAVLERHPDASVAALDVDTLALEATRANAPAARAMSGSSISDTGDAIYDAILSNPPIHDGVGEDHGVLDALIRTAPQHLAPRGVFQIVVQSRVRLEKPLAMAFGAIEIVARDGRFCIWRCHKRT